MRNPSISWLTRQMQFFTENGLNELCDYGVDESLIRKISKRSGIPYADPDEPDEEIPLKEAQPKKPGLFSSILMEWLWLAAISLKVQADAREIVLIVPPHYGCRYGRWYYGHGHTHGCEFCGNGGMQWEVQHRLTSLAMWNDTTRIIYMDTSAVRHRAGIPLA